MIVTECFNINVSCTKNQAIKNSVASKANQGASPYHPELYRQIVQNPDAFKLVETTDAVNLIEQIYNYII